LTVTVKADSSAVQGVSVIGQSPLSSAPLETATPYQFIIDVPRDITSGTYTLTALAIPRSGTGFILSETTIDIERSDRPRKIGSEGGGGLFLARIGATDYLLITGVFADGSRVILSRSKLIRYSSDNPAVATVDQAGQVTAVALGTANIAVTYGNEAIGRIVIKVPVNVSSSL
jgi:hypothetical protein